MHIISSYWCCQKMHTCKGETKVASAMHLHLYQKYYFCRGKKSWEHKWELVEKNAKWKFSKTGVHNLLPEGQIWLPMPCYLASWVCGESHRLLPCVLDPMCRAGTWEQAEIAWAPRTLIPAHKAKWRWHRVLGPQFWHVGLGGGSSGSKDHDPSMRDRMEVL